ncbi:holo-[acyl-carrier-protein] synthase [Sporobolomyces koalae]|uniref:holo-[acyl-carrier-protein] synthase n=1 Tax=Sporobolomyces koalae TaxID=500713 RepID=UPI00317DF70E
MQVHILRIDTSFTSNEDGGRVGPRDSLTPWFDLVTERDRIDVLKFRFLGDARRCLLGRILASFVLSNRLNLQRNEFNILRTSSNRPYAVLASSLEPLPIDFNVSHDSNLVAIASINSTQAGSERVGIDLMRIRNPWEGTTVPEFVQVLAEQLTEKERFAIEAIPDPETKLRHALALWTLKEAYVKATGQGLHCDLSRLGFELDLSKNVPGVGHVIGNGTLDGALMRDWAFDLVQLENSDGSYWMAIARNEFRGGGGKVLLSSSSCRPNWFQVLELDHVANYLRTQ